MALLVFEMTEILIFIRFEIEFLELGFDFIGEVRTHDVKRVFNDFKEMTRGVADHLKYFFFSQTPDQ